MSRGRTPGKPGKKVEMKAPTKSQKSLRRRDGTGHLDPKYAADLRQRSLESSPPDGAVAFLNGAKSRDSLAEALGEEFLRAATAGEDAGVEGRNRDVPEDDGGPFVITKARDEFALDDDSSTPPEATREPFPTAASPHDDVDP